MVTVTDCNGCTATMAVNILLDTACCTCGTSYDDSELVVNGYFDAGNSGFTSDLNSICGSCVTPAVYGSYCVSGLSTFKCSAFNLFGGHTSSFMMIDGDDSLPRNVWQEQVYLDSSALYKFCFFVNSYGQIASERPELPASK